jgi:hypothetical protein
VTRRSEPPAKPIPFPKWIHWPSPNRSTRSASRRADAICDSRLTRRPPRRSIWARNRFSTRLSFGHGVHLSRRIRRLRNHPHTMTTRLSGLCQTFLTLPGYAARAAPRVPVWVTGSCHRQWMVQPVCPQLRKCRVRPGSYAWCQLRKCVPEILQRISLQRSPKGHR